MAHAHDAAFAPDESDLVEVDVVDDARADAVVHPLTRAARRPCARPACPAPARATLRFAYDEREAHIEALAEVADPQAYDLCVTHADRTRPPHGWQLRDRRSDEDRQPDTPPAKPTDLGSERTVAVLAAALRAVPTSVPENGRGQPQVTEIASEGAGVRPADGGSPARPATAAVHVDADVAPQGEGAGAGAPVAMNDLFVVPDLATGSSDFTAVREDVAAPASDLTAPPIDDDPAWLDAPVGEWDDYDGTSPAATPADADTDADANAMHDHDVWSTTVTRDVGTTPTGGATNTLTGCGEAGCADTDAAMHHQAQHRAYAGDETDRAVPVSSAAFPVGGAAGEVHDIDAPTLFAAETAPSSAMWESTMGTVAEASPESARGDISERGDLSAPAANRVPERPDVRIVRVTADDTTALPGGPGFATSW